MIWTRPKICLCCYPVEFWNCSCSFLESIPRTVVRHVHYFHTIKCKPFTSMESAEVFLLICLPKSVLISTIIQSRLPLSHFPLNPLKMATSFSKLGEELSLTDFHLRFKLHHLLSVLLVSPEINCALIHFLL